MSDLTPPPAQLSTTPVGVIRAARALWITSFVLGFGVIAYAFLSRDHRIAQLSDLLAEVQPSRAAETLDQAAAIVFWVSVAVLTSIIIVEAFLLHAVVLRHRWAQWAQLLMIAVHAGLLLFAGIVVAVGDQENLVTLWLLVQLAIAVVALVVSFLPGSGAWFRARRLAKHHETQDRHKTV